MIALGVSYQTLHKVLGHYIVFNITKFQNCRRDNKFFTGEKQSQKHFENSQFEY